MMFLLVAGFILTACSGGSYSVRSGKIEAEKDRLYGSYQRFDGTYYRKVVLDEGDRLQFDLSVRTEEGTLEAIMLNSEEEKLLTISDGDTITVTEKGTYTMQVEASEHAGSFELHWETIE